MVASSVATQPCQCLMPLHFVVEVRLDEPLWTCLPGPQKVAMEMMSYCMELDCLILSTMQSVRLLLLLMMRTHTHTHMRARARTHTHTDTHGRACTHTHTHTCECVPHLNALSMPPRGLAPHACTPIKR